MLVIVTFFWGLSFALVKDWQDRAGDCPGGKPVAALSLIALRMLLGLVVLVAVRPRLLRAPPRAHLAGAAVGVMFFLGFALQTLGLTWTTPARSGFFTALCSLWVPLVVWVWFRQPVGAWPLAGLAAALAGIAVLTAADPEAGGLALNPGDWLTLAASAFFAVQVVLLDRLGRATDPARLTPTFFLVTGAGALAGLVPFGPNVSEWVAWLRATLAEPGMALKLSVMTVVSTVLAFHWMNVYQPRVSAARAALIYLLEPVFALLVSVAVGFDRWSGALVLGGLLVLAGNVLAEWPALRRGVDSGPALCHDRTAPSPPGGPPCPSS